MNKKSFLYRYYRFLTKTSEGKAMSWGWLLEPKRIIVNIIVTTAWYKFLLDKKLPEDQELEDSYQEYLKQRNFDYGKRNKKDKDKI